MKLDSQDHQIDPPHGIVRVMIVVGFRQRAGEVFGCARRVISRVVENFHRVNLDDGGKELFDEQPDFPALVGGGDEFAAGDGVAFADKGEDFPRDKREVGAAIEGVVAANHAADENAEDDAMHNRHRGDPADHRRPVTECAQENEEEKKLPYGSEWHQR